MTTLATAKATVGRVARPLKVLVPLIQNKLQQAEAASLEYYRQVGDLLLEAREQLTSGSWGSWLKKHFELSAMTAWRYMRLAERAEHNGAVMKEPTLERAIGVQPRNDRRYVGSMRPIRDFTARVPAERLSQERRTMEDEIRLHRELALQLIDIGYKALATRLHPDRGGSKDAMTRLNRVRDELKAVAETRRFL